MEKKIVKHPGIERWTARRKADLLLEIIKGQKTIVDVAREYDLKQSEVCVRLNAFATDEDLARFRPREVRKKVCIADPRFSLGEIRQTAERRAKIQAVRDFEPKLESLDDDSILMVS